MGMTINDGAVLELRRRGVTAYATGFRAIAAAIIDATPVGSEWPDRHPGELKASWVFGINSEPSGGMELSGGARRAFGHARAAARQAGRTGRHIRSAEFHRARSAAFGEPV